MKKQNIRFNGLIVGCGLLVLFILAGCAKEETTSVQTTSNSTTQISIGGDEVTLNDEFDQAADDAIAVICTRGNINITGTYIDTSQIAKGTIFIQYTGKEADGTKSRSGSDSIHMPMVGNKVVTWGTPGATASITFGSSEGAGYEVTFTSNNPTTSVRFNGTATLTNVSGVLYQNITATDSLLEIIRGVSVDYTFDDNAATIVYYPFNLNQKRWITTNGSTLFATCEADTAISAFTNVSNWGQDRFGNTYYTSITTKVVQNISTVSLSYNPISGVKDIQNIAEPITCTFGVNNAGTAITSGTPYGEYITWFNNGGGAQAVVPYYY